MDQTALTEFYAQKRQGNGELINKTQNTRTVGLPYITFSASLPEQGLIILPFYLLVLDGSKVEPHSRAMSLTGYAVSSSRHDVGRGSGAGMRYLMEDISLRDMTLLSIVCEIAEAQVYARPFSFSALALPRGQILVGG